MINTRASMMSLLSSLVLFHGVRLNPTEQQLYRLYCENLFRLYFGEKGSLSAALESMVFEGLVQKIESGREPVFRITREGVVQLQKLLLESTV